MFKYDEFILESQLDLINEAFVFLSPPLKKVLSKINSNISRDILDMEKKDIKDDITFIDIDKEPGYISFTTTRNAKANLSTKYPERTYDWLHKQLFENPDASSTTNARDLYNIGSDIWNKSRNPLRIGRLINKLFPSKYSNKDVEDFTNKFKSIIEKRGQKFKIVEGDEIAYWYNSSNYKDLDSGSLGNSCMKSKNSGYFKIYTQNPEVCRMLCLLEDEGDGDKLIARALIWKIESVEGSVATPNPEKFEYFLDRQYSISDDVYIEKMRSYAVEQGWAYKTNNNHHSLSGVTYKSEKYSIGMIVKLNSELSYSFFPYMDTFKRFDPNLKKLFNDEEESNWGHYLLNHTDGQYTLVDEDEDDEDVRFSEYYGCNIPEDQAVWSDPLEDYLWTEQSVQVRIGNRRNRGFYPDDYEDIRYDEWREEYIHVDDSVYSEIYGDSFYEEDAISVVCEVEKNGDCNEELQYIHSDDTDKYISFGEINEVWIDNLMQIHRNWKNHNGILKKFNGEEIITKHSDEGWYLKRFEIEINKMKNPILIKRTEEDGGEIYSMNYIDKLDAELLNIEITEETYLYDTISYIDDLVECNLFKKLKSRIISYIENQTTLPSDEFKEIKEDKVKILQKKLEDMKNFSIK
jgi:hypothetical protein